MSESPTIWINAGETSGDMHGARLAEAIAQIRPDARFTGMAGPAMRRAGVEAVARTEDLSVMGFTEVIARLFTIIGLLKTIKRELARRRPSAVVLIDAPAFNFRVARAAKKLGLPVFYYISPKLWAWRRKRAYFIRNYVDRMISILPFEREFYESFDVEIDYVGHPLVDELADPGTDAVKPEPGRVCLMPGSRNSEIESLLPVFADACERIAAQRPESRFSLVRAPGIARERIRELWPGDLPLEVADAENRYEHMAGAEIILAASGTATLECALLKTPTVVAYRLSGLTFALARRFVKVPFVSLPNLILGREVFPELLQDRATGPEVAAKALDWLEHPEKIENVRARLEPLREMLGPPGAPQRAAEIIISRMDRPLH
jgi:lipid-A-disaccharide synthase